MSPNGNDANKSVEPAPSPPGKRPAGREETLTEFLNPKSMITPGLAGALTMAITNSLCCNFGIQRPLIALSVAALFAVLAVGVAAMPLWQKPIYFLLNTLVVFTMALGANTAGETVAAPAKNAYPGGAFGRKVSIPAFASLAFAQEPQEGTLLKGSGPRVYVVMNGRRRLVPDSRTLAALGFDMDSVKRVDDAQLDAMPSGPDYPSLPGSVVKGSGPSVYLLQSGYKCRIPDRKTFEAMGFKADSIRVIGDEALASIPEGPPIAKVTSGTRQQQRFFAPWFQQ